MYKYRRRDKLITMGFRGLSIVTQLTSRGHAPVSTTLKLGRVNDWLMDRIGDLLWDQENRVPIPERVYKKLLQACLKVVTFGLIVNVNIVNIAYKCNAPMFIHEWLDWNDRKLNGVFLNLLLGRSSRRKNNDIPF